MTTTGLQRSKAKRPANPKNQNRSLSKAGFFQDSLKRMNDHEMRVEGCPICSGMIVSAVKTYRHHFCGPGIRWSRTGAERLIPIRSAILCKRFDKTWRLAYISPPN